MVEDYQLDKWLWTDADFDAMGWHDSLIYAFKVDQNLYFDIDYIFKWVQPEQDHWFSFYIAPCTLVFETPTKFHLNLESNEFYTYIEIADLHKHLNSNYKTEWRIDTHWRHYNRSRQLQAICSQATDTSNRTTNHS